MQEFPGVNLDTALRTKMGDSSYGIRKLEQDFKLNGATLINNVLLNTGVGSIVEIESGSSKSDASIIPDDPSLVIDNDGFNYVFNNNTHYDGSMKQPSAFTSMFSDKVLRTIAADGEMNLHIGANEGQSIEIYMPTITSDALGLSDVDIKVLPDYSLKVIDGAIASISKERSKLGALQNRLEHAYRNVVNSSVNLTAAESRIRDVDMAKEIMNHTKQNIIMQATQSMLAQANEKPQTVLQLIS